MGGIWCYFALKMKAPGFTEVNNKYPMTTRPVSGTAGHSNPQLQRAFAQWEQLRRRAVVSEAMQILPARFSLFLYTEDANEKNKDVAHSSLVHIRIPQGKSFLQLERNCEQALMRKASVCRGQLSRQRHVAGQSAENK